MNIDYIAMHIQNIIPLLYVWLVFLYMELLLTLLYDWHFFYSDIVSLRQALVGG